MLEHESSNCAWVMSNAHKEETQTADNKGIKAGLNTRLARRSVTQNSTGELDEDIRDLERKRIREALENENF